MINSNSSSSVTDEVNEPEPAKTKAEPIHQARQQANETALSENRELQEVTNEIEKEEEEKE